MFIRFDACDSCLQNIKEDNKTLTYLTSMYINNINKHNYFSLPFINTILIEPWQPMVKAPKNFGEPFRTYPLRLNTRICTFGDCSLTN